MSNGRPTTDPKIIQKRIFSVAEAAQYLGISISTLRRWEKETRLAFSRTNGGQRRYTKTQLDTLAKAASKVKSVTPVVPKEVLINPSTNSLKTSSRIQHQSGQILFNAKIQIDPKKLPEERAKAAEILEATEESKALERLTNKSEVSSPLVRQQISPITGDSIKNTALYAHEDLKRAILGNTHRLFAFGLATTIFLVAGGIAANYFLLNPGQVPTISFNQDSKEVKQEIAQAISPKDYLSLKDGGVIEGKVIFKEQTFFKSPASFEQAIFSQKALFQAGLSIDKGNIVVKNGSVMVAGNTIINSTGKIPAISGQYIADLDGSELTNVNADHLDGIDSSSFFRSDQGGTIHGATNFTATPGGNGVGGGPLYINPGNAPYGYTLFGVAVNNQQRFKVDEQGTIAFSGYVSNSIVPTQNGSFDLGSGSLAWRDLYLSGSINSGGSFNLAGDLAVNGGSITTTATTGNLFNTNATTLNIGGAATTLALGATTGTATINNQSILFPNATSLNASQAQGIFDSLAIGGGYGSTGVTISSAGTIQANGALTIDGSSTLTGAVGITSTLDITGLTQTNGGLNNTGAFTTLGAINMNTSGSFATNIGTGTNAGTITIGNASTGDLTLNDPHWSITGAGAASFANVVASGSISADSIAIGGGYGSTGVTIDSSGNLSMDGNLTVAGVTASNGNVTLGSTNANTITFNGVVASNIIADSNNTRNLGSAGVRWNTGYFVNVDATNITGTLSSGSTTSASWIINSDNATANAETSSIAFETGSNPINAVLQWNASGDAGRIDSAGGALDNTNVFNYPIGIYSQVSGGNQTFTSGTLFKYHQDTANAITQSGSLTGIHVDFSSNITVPNSANGNQTGSLITLKDGGNSATTVGYQTAGTLDYGLDLGGTFNSAEIRLSNGETIGNLVDGTIALGGNVTTSGNLNVNSGTGTITSGLINGQTISSAANFTGTVAISTSLSINGGTALTTTNQTGTGSIVMSTSPTLTTPNIGAATATTINGLTISSSTGTLTIANGKTLTTSNTLTFTGTDGTSFAFPSISDDVVGRTATQTLTNKTLTSPSISNPTFSGTIATALTASRALFTDASSNIVATGTSAMLASSLTDETGTGSVVFATAPTVTTLTVSSGGAIVRKSGSTSGVLELDNSDPDASVVNPNYIKFDTAGGSRWALGISAVSSNGNFELWNYGTSSGAFSISKTTNVVTLTSGLTVTSGGATITAGNLALSSGLVQQTGSGNNSFAGNVGIGTTTPGATASNGFTVGQVLEIKSSTTSQLNGIYLRRSDNAVGLDITSDNNSTGNIYFDSRFNDSVGGFQFRTQTSSTAVNALKINGNGNIGIGTTSPSAKLDVYSGSVSVNGNGNTSNSRITLDTGGVGGGVFLQSFGTARGSLTAATAGLSLSATGTDVLVFNTGSTERVRIDASGNVGIGTTSPGHKLDVRGDAGFYNSGIDGVLGDALYLGASAYPTTYRNKIQSSISSVPASSKLIFSLSTGLTSYADVLTLVGNGNVGIGTATPGEKFEVTSGNILISNNQYLRQKNSSGTVAYVLGMDASNVTRLYSTYGTLHINPDTTQTTYLNYNNSGSVVIGDGSTTTAFAVSKGNVNINSGLLLQVGSGNNSFAGNVGIGTTSPGAKLHVANTSADTQAIFGNGTVDIGISFKPGALSATEVLRLTGSGTMRVGSTGITDNIHFDTSNGVSKMVITNGGNVGIGTTIPAYQLSVYTDANNAFNFQSGGVADFLRAGTRLRLDPRSGVGNNESTVSGSNGLALGGSTDSKHLYISTGGNVGIGTTSPAFTLDVNGDVRMNQSITRSLTRTIPTTVNTAVDIGSIVFSNGGGTLWVSITVPSSGYSQAKSYMLPIQYNQTNGGWTTALATSSTGAYSGNDFELDVNVASSTAQLRIRRTAGATAGTAYVVIKQEGVSTDSFTASTSTAAVSAPTVYFGSTALTQISSGFSTGYVGINTVSPASLLSASGNFSLGTSYVGTAAPTNGAIIQGNVGIGTASPSTKFHVYDSAGEFKFQNSSQNNVYVSGTNTSLTLDSTSGNFPSIWLKRSGSIDGQISNINGGGGLSLFGHGSGGSTGLFITSTGNIGIGTLTPTKMLQINSSTLAGATAYLSSSAPAIALGDNATFSSASGLGIFALATGSGHYVSSSAAGDVALTVNGGNILFGTGGTPSAAATERMRITNGGNVGIGTTSPSRALHVVTASGTAMIAAKFEDNLSAGLNAANAAIELLANGGNNASATNFGPYINFNIDDGNIAETTIGRVGVSRESTATSGYFAVQLASSGSLSEKFRIDSNGNVGIGTTNPATKLHAYTGSSSILSRIETAAASDAGVSLKNSASEWQALIRSDGRFGLWNSSELLTVTTGGNVGIGTTSPLQKLHVTGAGLFNGNINIGDSQRGFFIDNDSTFTYGMSKSAAGTSANLQFFANSGTARMIIDSNGNVGIGTASVTTNYKTEINGAAKIGVLSQGYSASERFYPNVVSQAVNNTASGAWIVHTPITRASSTMFKIRVHGYAYGNSNNVDFSIVGYAYPGNNGNVDGVAGAVIAYNLQDDGNDGLKKYVGIDANGKVAIALGDTSLSAYFYRLSVDAWITTSTDYSTGWSIDQSTTSGFGWLDISGPLTANWKSAMYIDSNGNVGIGTTNPGSYKFNVNGNTNITGNTGITGNLGIGTTSPSTNLTIQNGSSYPAITLTNGTSTSFIGRASYGITGAGASDLGFSVVSGNNLIFAIGSTEKVRIDSNGNVGIGATSPTYSLDIQRTSADASINIQTTTSGNAYLNLTTAGNQLYQVKADRSNNYLVIGQSARGNDLVINGSNGNIGIGTTSPGTRLQVGSNADTSATVVRLANIGSSVVPELTSYFSAGSREWVSGATGGGSGVFAIGLNPATYSSADVLSSAKMVVDGSGNVGIGTTTPGTTLDIQASAASFRVKSTGDNAISSVLDSGSTAAQISQILFRDRGTDKWALRKNSSNDLDFIDIANSNTTSLYLKTGGNVGIGTTSPSERLHVYTNAAGTNTTATIQSGQAAQQVALQLVTATTNANWFMRIGGSSSDLSFYNAGAGAGDRMTIQAGGNVGIGTTSPAQKLTVSGAALIGPGAFNNSGSGYGSALSLSGTLDMQGNNINLNSQGSSGYYLNTSTLSIGFGGTGNITTAGGSLSIAPNGGSALLLQPSSGNVGIGTTSPSWPLDVQRTYTVTTAGEQYGTIIATSYNIADTSLKQALRVNASSNITSGSMSNLIGILNVNTANGNAGTTASSVGLWLRGDTTATTHTLTRYTGVLVNNGSKGAGSTYTNQVGVNVDQLTSGTNNTLALLGTTTSPSGNFGIYNSSTYNNYFAGNVGIGTTSPGQVLDVRGNIAWGSATKGTLTWSGSEAQVLAASGLGLALTSNAGALTNGIYINTSGNVGIGTTGASSLLSVNGNFSLGTSYVGTAAPTNGAIIQGNVGIGTTNPSNAKLDISASDYNTGEWITSAGSVGAGLTLNATGTSGNRIYLISTNSGAVIGGGFFGVYNETAGRYVFSADNAGSLYLNLPTSTGNNGLCWQDLAIQEKIVDCASAPVDLAENYGTSDTTIEAGDLVVMDGAAQEIEDFNGQGNTSKAFVKKTTSQYQANIIGVVSTNPNQVYGGDNLFSEDEHPVPVSLVGRIPVKVSTVNGPIKVGDPLTSSPISGVAMKATKAGPIIGVALEEYSDTTVKKIIVQIKQTWYDPDMYITDGGNLHIAGDETNGYTVSNTELETTNQLIDRIGAFAQIVVGSVRAGLINTRDLIANAITTGTLTANHTVTTDFLAQEATVSGTLNADTINAKKINGLEGTFNDLAASSAAVQKIAFEEATKTSQSIEDRVRDRMSRLETLVQEGRESGQIDETQLRALIDEATSSASLKWTAQNTTSVPSSQFADLELTGNLSTIGNLSAYGTTNLSNTTIHGSLSLIDENVNTLSLAGDSITSSGSSLKLLSANGVDIMNGALLVDASGNVTISGDLIVQGKLTAKKTETQDLKVLGANNEVAASLDASGSATIKQLVIDTTDETATDSATVNTKATAGHAKITAATTEVIIQNTKVTAKSLIYLTATSTTNGQNLYVKEIVPGESFKVAIDTSIPADIEFNWWIVEVK